MKRIDVKHRHLTLFLTLFCVLAGAFGMGEQPDERLFRSRTNHRARSSQSHQVLDSIHEDLLGGSDLSASPGNDPRDHRSLAMVAARCCEAAVTFQVLYTLGIADPVSFASHTRITVRDRAPPSNSLTNATVFSQPEDF